jgi:hypothetical protein
MYIIMREHYLKAMNFDFSQISQNPEVLGQVIGAMIGVAGLIIGTIITIFTSLIIRRLDIHRENKKEELYQTREQRQKEFRLRRQIYTEFLNKLSDLEETLIQKKFQGNINEFHQYWSNLSIKLDLVAGSAVAETKDVFETGLFKFAKSSLQGKPDNSEYIEGRIKLIQAIRKDMDLQ